jgi:hypothetical protein
VNFTAETRRRGEKLKKSGHKVGSLRVFLEIDAEEAEGAENGIRLEFHRRDTAKGLRKAATNLDFSASLCLCGEISR